jgi:cysteinyl-tRNA synthetase
MSKSLGNFVMIRDLLQDWPGDVLRFNMLRTHYRQPMDWTVAGLKESWDTLEHWYDIAEPVTASKHGEAFLSAVCDDLNTPQAIAELHQATPEELAGGLSLFGFNPMSERLASRKAVDTVEIARAIEARNAARKAKNFAEADRIRDELAAQGILLKDSASGTTWDVKR